MSKSFFKSFLTVILCFFFFFSCDKQKQVEKDAAKVRTEEYRSVTIINNLPEKFVEEYILTTDDGVMIARANRIIVGNHVFENFDKNEAYKDETQFKITLIDRYGLRYEKIFSASQSGNTDVVIDESNYVKQPGDWKRKVERMLSNYK